MSLNSINQHFPKGISSEIKAYVTNEVLLSSRYIFTWRKGRQQYGYCTHCSMEYKTQNWKHKSQQTCPKCNSECRVQSKGMGRQTMWDGAYFVYYGKSAINPEAIIARGFYVERDYRDDFRKVETKYKLHAYYLFEPGNSRFFSLDWRDYTEGKSVYSLFNTSFQNFACYCSEVSIKNAVKGTVFQYSEWERYAERFQGRLVLDMVRFFGLAAKYPCVEYFTKLGLRSFVDSKLHGLTTYSAVNWNGKTIDKVLRLSKQDIKSVLKKAHSVNLFVLKVFQLGKKDKSNFTIDEAIGIARHFEHHYDDMKKILKYASFRKALNYMNKQYAKDEKKDIYYSLGQVLNTWRDYINDCKELEMDLSVESIVFPKNLHQAHQNTIKQIKILGDKLLDMKIERRLKGLEKLNFEYKGLFIRPAANSQELIDEGKALNHCVGTYAERYAKGKTDILVIRKKSEPEKPFYTLEIKKEEILQTRGKRNILPTKKVQEFVDAFESSKLSKKGNGRRKAV